MIRKTIGILSNLKGDSLNSRASCKNVVVRNAYVLSILHSGGIPLVFPAVCDEEAVNEMVARVDGLLVTGGNDLQTQVFGEEPERKQGSFSPERDFMDLTAIRAASRAKKPILGICRGIQAINVCFGGTLYQDIESLEQFTVKHSQEAEGCYGSHTVTVQRDSILFPLLGEKNLVNSFHHQAVKLVAEGFHATAFAADGAVEAIERVDGPFVLGVQWHPELMASEGNKTMQGIFDLFLGACGR